MKLECTTDEKGNVRGITIVINKPGGEVTRITVTLLCMFSVGVIMFSLMVSVLPSLINNVETTASFMEEIEGGQLDEGGPAAAGVNLLYIIALLMVLVGLIFAGWGKGK